MAEKFTENTDVENEEIDVVELTSDDGKVLKFYHIATIEHKEKWYAFFQPAEKIDGVEPEEVVIFEIVGEEGNESLAPIEDEALLDEVYEAFLSEMDEDDCDCGCEGEEHHHDCNCGCKH